VLRALGRGAARVVPGALGRVPGWAGKQRRLRGRATSEGGWALRWASTEPSLS
jgi:hypothetical protein